MWVWVCVCTQIEILSRCSQSREKKWNASKWRKNETTTSSSGRKSGALSFEWSRKNSTDIELFWSVNWSVDDNNNYFEVDGLRGVFNVYSVRVIVWASIFCVHPSHSIAILPFSCLFVCIIRRTQFFLSLYRFLSSAVSHNAIASINLLFFYSFNSILQSVWITFNQVMI